MQRTFRYEEMLPDEFLHAVEEMPVFIVPTGLLEWHADHLPLGQDALKAHGICEAIVRNLGGGIVLPPNYYGRPGYASYVGTLTFSEKCLTLLFAGKLFLFIRLGSCYH
ncbi:MAG: creatininase family protein [Clostridia bacterium]|nr:creatininase family protein [Clostridia bacterium]